MQIISKATDGGSHVDKTFKFAIDDTDNKLKLYDGTTAIIEFDSTGVTVNGEFDVPTDTDGFTVSGLAVGFIYTISYAQPLGLIPLLGFASATSCYALELKLSEMEAISGAYKISNK